MNDPWMQAVVVPQHTGRIQVEEAMDGWRSLHGLPVRPRPEVSPYSHPSDGSTLVLLDEPASMTKTQVYSMAQFNTEPRYE